MTAPAMSTFLGSGGDGGNERAMRTPHPDEVLLTDMNPLRRRLIYSSHQQVAARLWGKRGFCHRRNNHGRDRITPETGTINATFCGCERGPMAESPLQKSPA